MNVILILRIFLTAAGVLFLLGDINAYVRQKLTDTIGLLWAFVSVALILTGVVSVPGAREEEYLVVLLLAVCLLLGAVENPYPYYRQTDIYVHATGYEGKSIAIQEAQTLGCAIVASECNREQITDGEDGILCALDAAAVKEAVGFLIRNPDRRRAYAQAALKRPVNYENEERLLEQLLSGKE